MNYEDLEALIELEKNTISRCKDSYGDHNCIGFEFVKLNRKEQFEFFNMNKITYEKKFILEAFTRTSCFELNSQLRERDIVPPEPFFLNYEKYLNNVLDELESYSNKIVWRWHVPELGLNFLKNKTDNIIQFPEFKSTSVKTKHNTTLFKINTSRNSNGKLIYKYLDKANADAEQEVLFKSMTKFKIMNSNERIIELKELDNQYKNIDIFMHNEYWEEERVYSERAFKNNFDNLEHQI